MDNRFDNSYDDHFTIFIDLLGFSESSKKNDEISRKNVLELLKGLSMLRGEFNVKTTPNENGRSLNIRPAISSFSDHILISYPITQIDPEESFVAIVVTSHAKELIAKIASAALKLGFLIRGGATIEKLSHMNNVVFGEALVSAYDLESKIANHPRVVISGKITSRQIWMRSSGIFKKSIDGLYYFDYYLDMLLLSSEPGDTYTANILAWFERVISVVNTNLTKFKQEDKLKELSKWAWFAHEFHTAAKCNTTVLNAFGISLDKISDW